MPGSDPGNLTLLRNQGGGISEKGFLGRMDLFQKSLDKLRSNECNA
jgi:hypothetical protein